MTQSTEVMAPITEEDLQRGGLPPTMKMAPGLAIYFVDSLYLRCKAVALRMSEARGMVGEHLLNNPGACMAIISRSITWNLDPFAVAQSTYAVKGKIGYEGKLCQAILENSGAIDGRVEFEFFGPWDKLRGQFKMEGVVGSGERKPIQKWGDVDEVGLGLKVSARVKGEALPRVEEFFLGEMWPRNSTLWVTRPKQQMRYAAVRAFGNIAVPGIFMGIPFDVDPSGMVDITPTSTKPQASEFERAPERDNAALAEWTTAVNFSTSLGDLAKVREGALAALPQELHERFIEVADSRGRAIAAKPVQAEKLGGDKEAEADAPIEPDKPGPTETKAEAAQKQPSTPNEARAEAGLPLTLLDADDGRKAPVEESIFQRGRRLLQGAFVAAELVDVAVTISGELKSKKDKTIWKQTCEARWVELQLPGKMPTAGL